MVTFKDTKDRTWTLHVNFGVVRRVERLLACSLLDILVGKAQEQAKTFRSFESVAIRAFEALTPESKVQYGVQTFEQFADMLYAESPFENLAAMEAAWEEGFIEFCGFDKLDLEVEERQQGEGLETESPPPATPGS